MKRSTRSDDVVEAITTANYLMLLSGGHEHGGGGDLTITNRVFQCKTCNRQFPSFQALGGHRASHKKPRLTADHDASASPPKPKTHECAICGLEFPIGQALGGHMRRHRSAASGGDDRKQTAGAAPPPLLSLSPPIVKRSNSRRVLCLDLNLTPSENKFLFGNIGPAIVDCFF